MHTAQAVCVPENGSTVGALRSPVCRVGRKTGSAESDARADVRVRLTRIAIDVAQWGVRCDRGAAHSAHHWATLCLGAKCRKLCG